MGAVKLSTDLSAVNNVDYVKSSAVATSSALPASLSTASTLTKVSSGVGSVLNLAGKVIPRANALLTLGGGLYDAYRFFTSDEKEQMGDAELQVVEQYEAIGGASKKSADDYVGGIQAFNDIFNYKVPLVEYQAPPTSGGSLLNILEKNGNRLDDTLKSYFTYSSKMLPLFLESIQILNNSLNTKLGDIDVVLHKNLVVQNSLVDVHSAILQVLGHMASSNVSTFDSSSIVRALDSLPASLKKNQEAFAIKIVEGLTLPLSEVVNAVRLIGTVSSSVQGLSVPLGRVSEAIAGIGAIPSTDGIVEAVKGIGTVSKSIDELAKLKEVDNEQVKEHYALREGEIELNKESMEYAKTAQSVKDLDGQVVASFAPREASLVKDVILAKDTTDKINFELPPELDVDLQSDNLDITAMFGYEDGEQIYKEFYRGMGGVGL